MTLRLLRSIGWPELASLALFALALGAPAVSTNLLFYSIVNQALIGAGAALSVYVMLRMDLLTFATPAFMALGGYGAALLSLHGVTSVLVLLPASFLIPAVIALPLGALVLRLRGTYFVLVTFILSQILQLLLFNTPSVTGGANGLAGIPPSTLFGFAFEENGAVLLLSAVIALAGAVVTVAVTRAFAPHFASIEENEVLAASLGLPVRRYKALGFGVAAGLAGLAGYSVVNMLVTAQPTSFSAISSVDYIAYVVVGGKALMPGPVLGSALLVTATNLFGAQGQLAEGLYGLLIIGVVLGAKGGLVGAAAAGLRRLRRGRAQAPRAELAPGATAP